MYITLSNRALSDRGIIAQTILSVKVIFKKFFGPFAARCFAPKPRFVKGARGLCAKPPFCLCCKLGAVLPVGLYGRAPALFLFTVGSTVPGGGNWGCLLHPWLLMLCTTGRTWYRRLCLVLPAVPRAGVPVGPGAASCVLWCRCFVLPGCTRYCRLFAARAVMPCIALYALWATPALMPLYGVPCLCSCSLHGRVLCRVCEIPLCIVLRVYAISCISRIAAAPDVLPALKPLVAPCTHAAPGCFMPPRAACYMQPSHSLLP